MLTATASSATGFAKIKPQSVNNRTLETTTTQIELSSCVVCNYDNTNYGNMAEYYTIVSNAETAGYNANAGKVSATNGWVMAIDFFNDPNTSQSLPAGTYLPAEDPYPDDPSALTYITDYSLCQYYDADGNITEEFTLSNPITVTYNMGSYTLTTEAKTTDGSTVSITYTGLLPFIDPSEKQSVYTQLNEDKENIEFVAGRAFYYGMFQSNKGGTMMVQLYTVDPGEGSGVDDPSMMICLDLIGKIYTDKTKIAIEPGTYPITPLSDLERNTAGACQEIDYMGQTIPLGTYLQDRNSSKYNNGNGTSAYGYLKTGTITIEESANGYKIELLDGVTDRGYKVTFSYDGPVGPIVDYSDDGTQSAMSTIEDDVNLSLDDLPISRVWTGQKNGCQYFTLDIGSRSGRDPERNNGGDIMRLEFVSPAGTQYIQPGSYEVMEDRYENYYEPWKLGQTYFVSIAGGGTDISGTVYMHFEEGRSYIMDHYAWFKEGHVTVTIPEISTASFGETFADNTVYQFDIDLIADNGFFVKGSWTGPVKLMYDPDTVAGIGDIAADTSVPEVTSLGDGRYSISGFSGTAVVYNIAGAECGSYDATQTLDLSAMPTGIYIIKLADTAIKISK